MTNSTLYCTDQLDARIPRWDMGTLTERDCPFCDAENESLLIRSDQLPVAFCALCGCWYVAEAPSVSDIERLYDDYYYSHRPSELSGKSVSRMLDNARCSSKHDWQLQTLLCLLGGIEGKRVLDVGCGCGCFLLKARVAGANVVGCDLSPEACSFAQNKLGIMVYSSVLQQCSSSVGNVDAVVMRDLIEHPVDPLGLLYAAYGILKPGGVLLLHTPNGGQAGTGIEEARKWVGFCVDLEHLQYISPDTINWLSRALNMRIERLATFGFPGLKGIDKLPRRKAKYGGRVRDIVKRIPFMSTMVRTLRTVKAEVNGGHHDPRLGSYHLFAVLRKV